MKKFLVLIFLSTLILNAQGFEQGKEYKCKVMKIKGSNGRYILRNKNNTERMDYAGSLSFKYHPGIMNINGVLKTGVDRNVFYFDHKFTYEKSKKTLDTYLDFKFKNPVYFSNEKTEVHIISHDYYSILECSTK